MLTVGGWVAAGDLEIGDTLVTADGNEVEVTDLEIEKLAEPITVYNLEVEDCHTYFVGQYGVLVHNYNPNGKKGGSKHQKEIENIVNSNSNSSIIKEFYVKLNSLSQSGKISRFIDIAILDANGSPVKFYQVGKVAASGVPVPREFSAIIDILQHSDFSDVPIEFIPYNI